MQDPYVLLGIPRTATAEEIKKAYRVLAKKCHPDLHPGDKEAEQRFKEINEAYEILGDEAKRKAFDVEQARTAQKAGKTNVNPKRAAAPAADFDISNLAQGFERFFGFDPKDGTIVDEEKLGVKKTGKKNPMDVSDLFAKYMGFK